MKGKGNRHGKVEVEGKDKGRKVGRKEIPTDWEEY